MLKKEVAPVPAKLLGAKEVNLCDSLHEEYSTVSFLQESYPDVGTVDDVAKCMQIKPAAVRHLCRTGELRAFKVGALWRIPRTWLAEFVLRKCEEESDDSVGGASC